MKKIATISIVLLGIGLTTSSTIAQIWPPNVEIHFSNGREAMDCPDAPAGTVIDSLYIVGRFLPSFPVSCQYMVSFPPSIMFLADNTGGLDIGSSPVGITTSWPVPLNCSVECLLNKILFIWNCQGCTIINIPIVVVPHPDWGCVRCWDWTMSYCVIGMTSMICSTLPVEDTSWGKIKSLYRQPTINKPK